VPKTLSADMVNWLSVVRKKARVHTGGADSSKIWATDAATAASAFVSHGYSGRPMEEDERCCGTGTCIINAEGLCWCGQQWNGTMMCRPMPEIDKTMTAQPVDTEDEAGDAP